MFKLPTEPVTATRINPRKLLIFGHTKLGKTSLSAQLPNSLLIDLESGSQFVDATKVDVKELAKQQGVSLLEALGQIVTALNEPGAHKYDYIILDNTTALSDIAKELGAIEYRKDPMGKSWKGTDILQLPMGKGYGLQRAAFQKIYNMFNGVPNKCLVLLGHVKDASVSKGGEDLKAKDLNLTGQLKNIVCADMDAIGFMYRDKKEPKNILSFKSSDQDLATGSRCKHLRNQEFVISELKEDRLLTYWDNIFIKN